MTANEARRGAWPPLPVDAAAGRVEAALGEHGKAVLIAEPGAGKTTRLPLHLMAAPFLAGRRMVMLEPRRLAARAAAGRLARSLGEEVGERVGYAVRFERRVGPRTRIEVVTEGVLARRLQKDPEIKGVGLLVFDEFHERSLDADLTLALALDVQGSLRPDLRLLVMSATLDAGPIARLLGGAPVIEVEGRSHPVAIRHLPPSGRLGPEEVVRAVRTALAETTGGVLVFLPGEREIRRAAERLEASVLGDEVDVVPLYGALSAEEQDRAIRAAPRGRRKVVLATTIAETSLTIEGIAAVVDTGLKRVPRFDPKSGMARLETVPVSLAAARQRAGRAGRLGPGVCYRLWDERKTRTLPERDTPEILATDLAPLVLDLAAWGVKNASALRWLDPPPTAAIAQGRALLAALGALDAEGRLTPAGRRMAELPLHPRLAHMVAEGKEIGAGWRACLLAALLAERDILRRGTSIDLSHRLSLALGGESEGLPDVDRAALSRVRGAARQIAGIAGSVPRGTGGDAGLLVALAYPDRIAMRRGARGRYLMAGGGGAVVDEADPLAGEEFLAVALTDGRPGDARVHLAARLDRAVIEDRFTETIVAAEEVTWDERAETVKARRVRRLGALLLAEAPLAKPDLRRVAEVLLAAVAARGSATLPWTPAARALQARLAFVRRHCPEEEWPDLDDAALMATIADWLLPHVLGLTRIADLARLDLSAILASRLTSRQRRRLDELAPERLPVPSGAMARLDYERGEVPVLSARLQELFSLTRSPRIAGGRVAVKVELLSPAGRPLAVTQDLASFWRNAYPQVRAETRGRYPKHAWPEDPLTARPVAPGRPR